MEEMKDELIERKRGKLSIAEREYIEQNSDKASIEEIARALNRTIAPIARYQAENDLVSLDHSKDLADDIMLKQRLHNREYWPVVRDKILLDEQEVSLFEDYWVKYFKQFGDDVVTSEEHQIKDLILIDIQKIRTLSEIKIFQLLMRELREVLQVEQGKPPGAQDESAIAMLTDKLLQCRLNIAELEKINTADYKQSQDLLKSLRATREQRIKHIKDAETSFAGWLYELEDERKRKAWSNELEIGHAAGQKASKELREYHTYEDGMVDKPLLIPEDFINTE